MNKNIIALGLGAIIIMGTLFFVSAKNNTDISNGNHNNTLKITAEFIDCLQEEGVVIYGSSTCPACKQLEDEYGGYDAISSIYIDCSGFIEEQDMQKCIENMETQTVPEIQIKGERIEVWGSPKVLARKTGCEL